MPVWPEIFRHQLKYIRECGNSSWEQHPLARLASFKISRLASFPRHFAPPSGGIPCQAPSWSVYFFLNILCQGFEFDDIKTPVIIRIILL